MSDLISRQAAIEAINHICQVDTEYDCTLLDRVDVRCVLSDLPSAQAEQRWIPVSERLPEEPGTYMTTADYGKYGLSVRQKYYYGQGLGWSYDRVIAWMPLPEPYKEVEE